MDARSLLARDLMTTEVVTVPPSTPATSLARLLADRGILESVPVLDWYRIAAEARQRHATPETLVEVVHALTPLLERHMPVGEGDVDELCNVPRFVIE